MARSDSLPRRLQLLSSLEDGLMAGVASLRADGRIVERSEGFERLLGGAALLHELVAPEHGDALRAALASVRDGEPERALAVRVHHAGASRSLELRLRRALEPGGPLTLVVRDRAETDRIERHLLHSERLRLIGEMVLGCTHELNNLLGVISQVAEASTAPEPGDLALLRRSAVDARSLVLRLQSFARQEELPSAADPVDPREILQEALDFTRLRWQREAALAGAAIEVEADLQPAGLVVGSAAQLRHAATNLIANALDAMPRGGRLRVACRRDGAEAVLEIADSGAGIAPELERQIFEPFFSTKGEGGLGLGLSIVGEVVSRHGGQLRARSSPDRGSVFEIRLPVSAVAALPAAPAPVPHAEPCRILLVDDNATLRRFVARALRGDGHDVRECGSAEEAERLAADPAGVDLLILDVSLPGRSGVELIGTLRARQFRAPVLLITAWGLDLGAAGATRVLTKPFGPDALRRAVAELRGARPD